MITESDYYGIFRIKPDGTSEEIKSQYRRLAKIYHPDRNPGEEEWCQEQLRLLNAAFAVLSDPDKRAAYDLTIANRSAPFQAAASSARTPRPDDFSPRGGDGYDPNKSNPASATRAEYAELLRSGWTSTAPATRPRRSLAGPLAGAGLFAAACAAISVFVFHYPVGPQALSLAPAAYAPARPQPERKGEDRSSTARRTRSLRIHRTSAVHYTREAEEKRLNRLGIQLPSGGFSASELRAMANRVQQYDSSH